jgi:hypothetical protein
MADCGAPDCPGSEAGSAIIEFVFLGVLLLVPLVYLVVTASQLQAGSYAAVGAADHAAKVFVTATNEGDARARASDAVAVAVGNMGLDPGTANMRYACSETCLAPGSTVTVHVDVPIALPLLPPGVDARVGTATSSATHRVDRFG